MANRYTQYNHAQFQPLGLNEMAVLPSLMRQKHDALDTAMLDLDSKTFANSLDTDRELVNEKLGEIKGLIGDAGKELSERGYSDAVKKQVLAAQKKWNYEFMQGDVAKAQQNLAAYSEDIKQAYERFNSGKGNITEAQLQNQLRLTKAAYDTAGGVRGGASYGRTNLAAIDKSFAEQAQNLLKDWKADKTPIQWKDGSYVTFDGSGFYHSGSKKYINEEELYNHAMNTMMSDPMNIAWARQQTAAYTASLGEELFEPVNIKIPTGGKDKKGNLIFEEKTLTGEEAANYRAQQYLTNLFDAPIRTAAAKNAYTEIDIKHGTIPQWMAQKFGIYNLEQDLLGLDEFFASTTFGEKSTDDSFEQLPKVKNLVVDKNGNTVTKEQYIEAFIEAYKKENAEQTLKYNSFSPYPGSGIGRAIFDWVRGERIFTGSENPRKLAEQAWKQFLTEGNNFRDNFKKGFLENFSESRLDINHVAKILSKDFELKPLTKEESDKITQEYNTRLQSVINELIPSIQTNSQFLNPNVSPEKIKESIGTFEDYKKYWNKAVKQAEERPVIAYDNIPLPTLRSTEIIKQDALSGLMNGTFYFNDGTSNNKNELQGKKAVNKLKDLTNYKITHAKLIKSGTNGLAGGMIYYLQDSKGNDLGQIIEAPRNKNMQVLFNVDNIVRQVADGDKINVGYPTQEEQQILARNTRTPILLNGKVQEVYFVPQNSLMKNSNGSPVLQQLVEVRTKGENNQSVRVKVIPLSDLGTFLDENMLISGNLTRGQALASGIFNK